jgi:hypothetical protein
MTIPINTVKQIRESLGMTHLVIIARDKNGTSYVASHGDTWEDAKNAAYTANFIKRSLGWPDNLCQAEPLERICKNCTLYEPMNEKMGQCNSTEIGLSDKSAIFPSCRYFVPLG